MRAAMQQPEISSTKVETLLTTSGDVADERIAEAQRIADRATANAVQQSEDALQSALSATPLSTPVPPTPDPVSPEIVSPDPTVRGQVH